MEMSLKGNDYRLVKLNVFDQLKVTRKLLPVLAGLVSDFSALKSQTGSSELGSVLETALPKIAHALAGLPEEDVNAILHPCLAVVMRKHDRGWTPVFNQGQLMFDDIDLMTLLSLVAQVVADSLGNFLRELPGNVAFTPAAD